jgi:hypothetical protein
MFINQALVDKVKRALLQVGIEGIAGHDPDVAKPATFGFGAGHGEKARFALKATTRP